MVKNAEAIWLSASRKNTFSVGQGSGNCSYNKLMSDSLTEMPLLPMDTVLFPHSKLMLHITDSALVELILECRADEKMLGAVLKKSEESEERHPETHLVGTAARVVAAQELANGQVSVTIQGADRFRIRRFDESHPVLIGQVEPVHEIHPARSARATAIAAKARQFAESYIQSCFSGLDVKVSKIELPNELPALSFLIAGLLQTSARRKQHLLETTETTERLAAMIPLLEEQMHDGPAPAVARANVAELLQDISTN
jgi:ATP-dependent Lon protease